MPLTASAAVFSANGFSIKPYQKELSTARERILKDSDVVKTAHGLIEYSTAGKDLPVLFIHGAGGGHFVIGIQQQCRDAIAGFLSKHL